MSFLLDLRNNSSNNIYGAGGKRLIVPGICSYFWFLLMDLYIYFFGSVNDNRARVSGRREETDTCIRCLDHPRTSNRRRGPNSLPVRRENTFVVLHRRTIVLHTT